MRTRLAVPVAFALLAGCAVGPNYRRPTVATPPSFRGQVGPAEAGSLADRPWWEVLDDDTLRSLLDEALAANYDLRVAAARVAEARAAAGVARSEFLPTVQAQAGWSRSRPSPFSGAPTTPIGLYQANASLGWEIDLWGRIRRLNQEAFAQYLATQEARRGVMLSLVADVATGYFQLRKLDLQLEIAQRTTNDLKETHDLFQRRFDAGAASALETASAEASLEATAANVPNLERQIAAQENQIALLLGRPPEAIPRGATLNDRSLPPQVPAGLPSDLLQRRPDVRQAEDDLIAANAAVGVAKADFFPAISLTGLFGGVAPQLAHLLSDGRTWSVGGGLVTPVVQGKALSKQYQAAVARWEQAKAQFEQTVTGAFADVSTALIAYQKLAAVEEAQARSVAAYQQAVQLSNQRYLAGLSDYLEVLQARQAQLAAENALAETRFSRLSEFVQLYKALGGGWNLADEQWPHPVTVSDARRPQ
jgi:outer membrane protein, multidrug efflux system